MPVPTIQLLARGRVHESYGSIRCGQSNVLSIRCESYEAGIADPTTPLPKLRALKCVQLLARGNVPPLQGIARQATRDQRLTVRGKDEIDETVLAIKLQVANYLTRLSVSQADFVVQGSPSQQFAVRRECRGEHIVPAIRSFDSAQSPAGGGVPK